MNKKMLPYLSRKGDPRVGQRGSFNPQAALNYYDRAAADAADGLRRLIEKTFGDKAEAVKEQIRARYDDADIPDADENATVAEAVESLKAIIAFYHQVRDEIEEGVLEPPQTEPETIFEMAKELIENKSQWSSGETVTLWIGKACKAYVTEGGYDGGGLLYLGLQTGLRAVEEVAGMLNPLKGWQFTLTQRNYISWVHRARGVYRLAQGCRPDIMMDFGKGDVNYFREGRLSPEYRKRAQRASNTGGGL